MDQVLRTPPPPVDVATAPAVAAATFGIEADSAIDLGSERDRAFLLHGVGALGEVMPIAVMKVSNVAEHPDVLDMEAAVAFHALMVDPTLPVAQPYPARDGR